MRHFVKNLTELEHLFAEKGIPTIKPGFYDHPNFLAEEGTDHTFLNCYASYVKQRPRSKEYDARVRFMVPRIAEILHRELVAEARLGACVDMSMVVSRILEAEGIWNYQVKGALTMRFPPHLKMENQYFWPIEVEPITGHSWVAAPPFDVVDITVRQQPYHDSRVSRYLQPYVLLDDCHPGRPTVEDICSPERRALELRKGRGGPDLHFQITPNLRHVFALFPTNEQFINKVRMKYIPCAFGASEGPLSEIKNQKWNGRYGFEIYEEMIRGQFG